MDIIRRKNALRAQRPICRMPDNRLLLGSVDGIGMCDREEDLRRDGQTTSRTGLN